MAKPRRTRRHVITHARAKARLQKGTQGIMSDYTMAGSTSWRCPNCMAIVPSGQSHACTTAYPPFEPSAHALEIQAEADRLRAELAQARAERDAARDELNAAQIEIQNQLTALKIHHCAEVVEPLTAQLMAVGKERDAYRARLIDAEQQWALTQAARDDANHRADATKQQIIAILEEEIARVDTALPIAHGGQFAKKFAANALRAAIGRIKAAAPAPARPAE